MPDSCRATGAPWSAKSSGSCQSIAFGWLALFGPRPGFIFSTYHTKPAWLQWNEGDRHHGLARFHVAPNGEIDNEPMQAIQRKKPCQVSSKQWGRY